MSIDSKKFRKAFGPVASALILGTVAAVTVAGCDDIGPDALCCTEDDFQVGGTVTFEGDAGHSHLPNSEAVEKHRAHWDAETIQPFWLGETFQQPGETFAMGYELAAVLFDVIRKELQPPPEAFRAFVQAANRADAGAAAAREHLRVELGELVEAFLGPGDWNPRPGL